MKKIRRWLSEERHRSWRKRKKKRIFGYLYQVPNVYIPPSIWQRPESRASADRFLLLSVPRILLS